MKDKSFTCSEKGMVIKMMDFRDQLINLGISPGDVILMHSSIKALNTTKTPKEFIEDIQRVLGPEGTLLIPALTYSNVNKEQPYFSVQHSLPCIGVLPNIFMNMEGVVRSVHPTHSVCAWGKYAKEITANHELDDTPLGKNSPFMRLPQYGGKILMVGPILHACTFMHGVEELAGAPYLLTKEKIHYVVEGYDEVSTDRYMYGHDFKGYGSEYGRIEELLTYPDIKTGYIGEANSYLIDSNALLREGVKKIKASPYYFVEEL